MFRVEGFRGLGFGVWGSGLRCGRDGMRRNSGKRRTLGEPFASKVARDVRVSRSIMGVPIMRIMVFRGLY